MIGGSLLALLPKGFFSWPVTLQEGVRDQDVAPMVPNIAEERKRRREKYASGGSTTPTLISPVRVGSSGDLSFDSDDDNSRARKRLRGRSKLTSVPTLVDSPAEENERKKQTSDFLRIVPEDAIAHCLSFLGTAEDRFALQTTCKSFRDISNSDDMLEKVNICGNKETGKYGIILEADTPSTAAATLSPFARAGNLDALYM